MQETVIFFIEPGHVGPCEAQDNRPSDWNAAAKIVSDQSNRFFSGDHENRADSGWNVGENTPQETLVGLYAEIDHHDENDKLVRA